MHCPHIHSTETCWRLHPSIQTLATITTPLVARSLPPYSLPPSLPLSLCVSVSLCLCVSLRLFLQGVCLCLSPPLRLSLSPSVSLSLSPSRLLFVFPSPSLLLSLVLLILSRGCLQAFSAKKSRWSLGSRDRPLVWVRILSYCAHQYRLVGSPNIPEQIIGSKTQEKPEIWLEPRSSLAIHVQRYKARAPTPRSEQDMKTPRVLLGGEGGVPRITCGLWHMLCYRVNSRPHVTAGV